MTEDLRQQELIQAENNQRWVWAPRVDPDCGEYGVFMTRGNRLPLGGPGSTLTGMRVILSNSFAPMPLVGHTFASAQFVGRGPTEVAIQITGKGDYELSRVQEMVEETEANARMFKRIKGAARIDFEDNDFLKLCGIEDGLVSSVDTQTDPQGTDLFRAHISFSSDGHHTESFSQEMYQPARHLIEILRVLAGYIQSEQTTEVGVTDDGVIDNALTQQWIAFRDWVRQQGYDRYIPIPPEERPDWVNFDFDVSQVPENMVAASSVTPLIILWWVFTGHRPTFENPLSVETNIVARQLYIFEQWLINGAEPEGLDPWLEQQGAEWSTWGADTMAWLGDAFGEGSGRQEALRRGGFNLPFPYRTDWPPGPQREFVNYTVSECEHEWLREYLDDLAHRFRVNAPLLPQRWFFRGERRGQYRSLIGEDVQGESGAETESAGAGQIYNIVSWPSILRDPEHPITGLINGRHCQWISPSDIERSLIAFDSQIREVAQNLFNNHAGRPEFNQVFGDLSALNVGRELTVHPTYPDLDLPPHPATGRVVDTEPDYYFFNDGEEGLLNEIGPDVLDEIDLRLQRMERTFQNLMNGQTWRETYIGRSRIGPEEVNTETGTITPNGEPFPMAGPDAFGSGIDPSTARDDSHPDRVESAPRIGGGVSGSFDLGSDTVADRVLQMSPAAQSSRMQEVINRRVEMIRRTRQWIPPEADPNQGMQIGPIDEVVGSIDRSHSFSRNAVQQIALQALAQVPETTLTMRRAFPTFKVYFIEDDTGEMRNLLPTGDLGVRPVMYFDDLYNYNSVKSIRLVRSRKSPSDLLVLELTNVAGLLERRTWTAPSEEPRELYAPGLEETEFENPLKKLILKEGLKIMARLGYNNHPLKCGEKFIGEIVELSYNAECTDEVTVICQSYGSELVVEPKCGQDGQRVVFRDTPDLVHTMMCSPELVHFGRFALNPQFNPAEARTRATSRGDTPQGNRVRAPGVWYDRSVETVIDELRDILCTNGTKWLLANNPADDNIYAPSMQEELTWWQSLQNTLSVNGQYSGDIQRWVGGLLSGRGLGWARYVWMLAAPRTFWLGQAIDLSGMLAHWTSSWFSQTSFRLTGQTIWEALKEAELRHPGWIAHPRPYGTRMTLFFGVPSHCYWADEISSAEQDRVNRLRSLTQQRLNTLPSVTWNDPESTLGVVDARQRQSWAWAFGGGVLSSFASLYNNVEIGHAYYDEATRYYYGRLQREIARTYLYREVGEYIGRTFGRFRPFRRYHLVDSEHHLLMNNIRASDKDTFNCVSLAWADGLYTLKADDSIPDEETIVAQFPFPSCDSEDMARRYCIGLLQRHLKDVYKGEILTIGMDIDPYDQVYLMDKRTGMYGVFDVQQVVDTFTAETGWITEITPDLIVGTNEWSTTGTSQALWGAIGNIWERYQGDIAHTAANAVVGLGVAQAAGQLGTVAATGGLAVAAAAALAYQGGYWIVRWTQDRQPIWVLPLILGERPFFAGLDGFRQDGIFASVRGSLIASFDAVREGWRAFHLGGMANDFSIGVTRWLGGQDGGTMSQSPVGDVVSAIEGVGSP